jgi:hypothetical protein
MRTLRQIVRPATCVAIVVLLTACEDDVAAPSGVEQPFSAYGIINPRLNTQALLVSPVEDQLYPLADTIDASVRSIDLATGTQVVWGDSVVENETGQADHVFWAAFRPDFQSRHRIEIVRSDGALSTVEIDVPARIAIEEVETGTRYSGAPDPR